MIKVVNLEKTFASEIVLSKASFVLNEGEKMGLVGSNGVGKSTLLKILAGNESADSGTIIVPPGKRVGYLPQGFDAVANQTVLNFLMSSRGLNDIKAKIDTIEKQLSSAGELHDEKIGKEYGDLLEEFERNGGWTFDSRVDSLLRNFQLGDLDLDREMSSLSGGQKTKIALIQLLLGEFDYYLLDEPTNNLDLPSIVWLEDFLLKSNAGMMIVSHDRKFLDRVVRSILEVDQHHHNVQQYHGSYSEYVKIRGGQRERQYQQYNSQQEEIKRVKEGIRKKQQWASRGQKGPRMTDSNKLAAGAARDRSSGLGSAAQALGKKLERMDLVEKPRETWQLKMNLSPSARSGDIVLEMRDVTKGLGEFKLGPIDLTLNNQDRVAILGENGVGKSTLIKLITRELVPDSGSIQFGSGVVPGYFSQEHEIFIKENTVYSEFMRYVGMTESDARTLLAKFSFSKEAVFKKISMLSLGERARLTLCILMAKGCNLLLLDEPSNHLDIEATEQLETALSGYDGTFVIISHDRYLLSKIHITKTYSVRFGGNLESILDYEEYEANIRRSGIVS